MNSRARKSYDKGENKKYGRCANKISEANRLREAARIVSERTLKKEGVEKVNTKVKCKRAYR